MKGSIEMLQIKEQLSRGVPRKRYSENLQQTYRRTPTPRHVFCSISQIRIIKKLYNHI